MDRLTDRLTGRRPLVDRTSDVLSDVRGRLVSRRRGPTIAGMSLGTAAAVGAGAIASMVVLPRLMTSRGTRQGWGGTMAGSRTLSVGDVMTRDVVTASPDTTLQDLARLMESRNVGTVIITSDGQLRGLVTDRQIVTHGLARGMNPDSSRAEEIMTRETPGPGGVVTAHPRMDLLEAARLIGQHRIRRLPVVEDGRLVGILSVADLADEVKEMVSAMMDELSRAEK